ncbi:MAG: hypothetical protein AAGF92_01385 [Myxococcota bacterium]
MNDACDGNRTIAWDFTYALEKYIKLSSTITHGGICPVIGIYGYSGDANVYTFAYWTNRKPK